MAKVKMLVSQAGPKVQRQIGKVYDLPNAKAARFVEQELAIYTDEDIEPDQDTSTIKTKPVAKKTTKKTTAKKPA